MTGLVLALAGSDQLDIFAIYSSKSGRCQGRSITSPKEEKEKEGKKCQRAQERKEQTLKYQLVASHLRSLPSHSLRPVNHPCRLTKPDK